MKKSAIVLIALDVIVVAALGAATVFLHTRVETLTNTISYIQDNTDILVTDMSNLQSNIKATLEEEASKVENWSVDVIDTDFEAETYTVHVSVVPKEYTETTQVSVYFGPNEYPLELDGIKFVGDVTLPLSESYKGNLTFLFVDGESRATEVRTDYEGIQEEFSNVVSGKMAEAPTFSDGKLVFNTSNDVNLNTGKYGIQAFDLIVERMGYNPEIDEDDADSKDKSDDSKTSGTVSKTGDKVEECERIDLINALSMDRNAILDSGSQTTVAGEVELKKSFDVSADCSVRVYLSVETSEGFTFEYDLYNGTINDDGTAIVDEIPKAQSGAVTASGSLDKNASDKDEAGDSPEDADSSDNDSANDDSSDDSTGAGSTNDDAVDTGKGSDESTDTDNKNSDVSEVDHFAPNAKVYDAKGSVYYLN